MTSSRLGKTLYRPIATKQTFAKFPAGRYVLCESAVSSIPIRYPAGTRRMVYAHPRLDRKEPADWRAGHDAVYQLAALTIGAYGLADAQAPYNRVEVAQSSRSIARIVSTGTL